MALLIKYMFFFSTEVTSSKISSDSPLYQRTKKAYELIKNDVFGSLLEIGPGEGYGLNLIKEKCTDIYAIDKANYAVKELTSKFPEATIIKQKVPPLPQIKNESLDFVICFQVIEHIRNDLNFLKEIHKKLKPGGTLFLTTPNIEQSVARNPWHYREYKHKELEKLLNSIFNSVIIKGIKGNELSTKYYIENKKRVQKILKWDFLRLEKKLPSLLLKIPYEVLNRINRKKLLNNHKDLVHKISSKDYILTDKCDSNSLDFFCIIQK
ncbi:class I SAM-dependent methyltransferase [uncultured Tenacibaculum sp.]|uniref:class I SAM-dependent methyltransferase n=1 Tax=uncultured Tenacibaculum sp. TaxID=174713 RepID=UPI00263519F9|nr:class I SAM-dependent methyltransferase [uncultured Tenacibaculum sp.]